MAQNLTADLSIADGTIIQQVDRFNLHEWAYNAYGAVGGVFGGRHVFERRIAAKARKRLASFLREQHGHAQ